MIEKEGIAMKIEENEHFNPKRTRRPWAVLFALILMGNVFVSIIGNVGAVDIYEPDDSAAQATIIPTDGTSQSHDLDPIGDEDWLNFTIIPGTTYTIETLNLSPSCDTFIELFESDGVTLIDWDDNSGPDLGSRIIWNTTGYPAGYYYVRVTEDGGNGGPGYTYDVRIFEGTYAEFFPPHSDYGLDTDGDPLFNYLVVNVTVNVSREGMYRLYSALYDSSWNWMDDAYNDTFLSAGIQIVEIRFDGWRIFNNGDNGSYNVQLWLRDDTWDLLDMDTHTTVFYTYDQFQPPPASFMPPHSDYGLDTDGDTLFNYLVVNVTVDVIVAGNYEVRGYLYDSSWNWIEDRYNYTFLAVGVQIVELRFTGWTIYNNGDNGTYYVNLDIRDEFWNWLDWDTHTTNFYTYDQFQPPPASLTSNFNDYGLDTDGDPYYNYLVIEVEVDVLVAGNYYVEVDLHHNATGAHIDQNSSTLTFLPAGIQTIPVYFDGHVIRQSGYDGPYRLDDVWLYDENWTRLDYLNDPYVTAAYNWTEFQPPPAEFEPPHSDYGLDTDSDTLFNYLVVNVTVNVSVAGNYNLQGTLYDSSWNWVDDDYNYTYLLAGIQIVELRFEGQRIYSNGDSGFYNVELYLYDESWNYLDYDSYTTNFYTYNEFQPPPAMFQPPHWDYGLDTDSDTLFNYLVVNVSVNVSVAGNYNLQGTLYDSSFNWVDDDYNYTYLPAGIQIVELRFEGQRIHSNGDSGLYNVNLWLYDDSWNLLDTDTHTTNFYTYDQFQPPPAMFQPPHSDYGLDTDGDFYYNYLIVNVSVNVSVAGNYNLEGNLRDSSFNWMGDDYNYTFLSAGIQIVQLWFEGWRIYSNGDNGFYNVDLDLYDDSWNWLDSDTYITSFYTYDEFQPPPARFDPPHSDYGLDTDGDSYFNYLVVNVTVNVSVEGNFEIRGRLRDSSWNLIETVYNNTFLPVGNQTVELRFEGWRIYSNGDNCSYTVELRLRDGSWNVIDTDTYTTNFYTYDEFQPPPAMFQPPHSDYGLDTDGDVYFDYLIVNVTVNVSVQGTMK
jgi:hypothetical protein